MEWIEAFGSRVTHVVWRLSLVCAEPKRVTWMSDVARARGPAARRRERRLRAFWRHEIMSVKMATNSANHHSSQRPAVLYVDIGTQTCSWTFLDLDEESLERRRLVGDQDTILELTGKIQELHNEINCMNDSRDVQDAESVRSGNSHVTSQPMFSHLIQFLVECPVVLWECRAATMGRPSIRDTPGISGDFCKSSCVFPSTSSARITSTEFVNRRATPPVHSGEE